MEATREELNRFLVDVFHNVLRVEEKYLRLSGIEDLSISEMHVLEAVELAADEGKQSAKHIASLLGITPGSLSAAIKVLEKKGYLQRQREEHDRRLVSLSLTDSGREASRGHEQIHRRMVDDILQSLSPEQAGALVGALRSLTRFFSKERTMNDDSAIR